MKKEVFALVLLGALFAAGLFNTQYLKDFTGGIGEELALSRAYCENGEYELSLEHARAARELWDARATYAGIFIRHSEIDAVSDGFYALTGALESDEPRSARTIYAALAEHVDSLYEMERLTLGSIF